MTLRNKIRRRKFLGGAASSVAAATVLPRRVLGGQRRIGPNDKLNLACVGIGFQGQKMLRELVQRSDVHVVAVCDPNTDTSDYVGWGRGKDGAPGMRGGRELGREIVEEAYGRAKPSGSYKGCAAYSDFREMLEKEKDLDAVHIVTPDHLHASIAVAAMKKGKHAATHKPVGNIMHETRLTVETARKTGQATHLHAWSERQTVATMDAWLKAGLIGNVCEVHRWLYKPIWPQGTPRLPEDNPPVPKGFDWDLWLGPVPDRPYSPAYTHAVYRGWYDFGAGCLADMGNYGLWHEWNILELGAPTSAEACASVTCEVRGFRSSTVRNDVSFPHASTIRFTFPARGKRSACDVYWYDGGMRPPTPAGLRAEGKQMPRTGVMFVGDEGTVVTGYYYDDPQIYPVKKRREILDIQVPQIQTVSGSDEWIGAFRGGKPSRGSFQNAQHLAEATCLGNVAVRLNSRVEWDDANMRITNLPAANKLLRRETYREGWEL